MRRFIAAVRSVRIHITAGADAGEFERLDRDLCSIALTPYLAEVVTGWNRFGRLVDLRRFPAFRVVRRSVSTSFRVVCADECCNGRVVEIRWNPPIREAARAGGDSKKLKGVQNLVA